MTPHLFYSKNPLAFGTRGLAKPVARFFSIAMLLALGASRARAVTLEWDPGQGATATGTGSWDLTSQFWYINSVDVAWPNGGNDVANFGDGGGVTGGSITPGTATTTAAILVNQIQFYTNGFTVANGTGGSLTFSGMAPAAGANTGITGTINAAIGGTAGLTKTGAGTVVLSGANTYTGTTTLTAGTLQLGGTGTLGAVTNTLTTGAGTLDLNGTNQTAVAFANNTTTGTITNNSATVSTLTIGNLTAAGASNTTIAGNLALVDNGELTLGGTNTFTGGLTINGNNTAGNTTKQYFQLTSPTGAGTGTITVNNGTSTGGFLLLAPSAAATVTVANNITSTSGGTVENFNGTAAHTVVLSGVLNLSGPVVSRTTNTLNFASPTTAESTISGVIGGTGGFLATADVATISIIKSGAGTLNLSGANIYTSGTTVSAGKLRLTNTTGSATGTGAVALSGGTTTTISGNGFSTGLLTVTAASRLAPGVNITGANGNFGTPATLSLGTTGGMTLTSASLDFDLASTAAGANDRIATGGALTLGALAFTFNETNGSLDTANAYQLVTGATSTGGFNAANITTTLIGGTNYTPTYSLNGTSLQVTFAPVPEPSTWAMLGLGLGLLGVVQHRRQRA